MSTATKLTYLNDTKTLLRNGINALGGGLTTDDTFRSYVNALDNIYDYLPKVTGTGTSVTLDGVRDGGLRITLNPTAISQDGTPTPDNPQDIHTISGSNSVVVEGKNLFDISKIVKGRLDNGVIGYESGTTALTKNDTSFTFTTNANYRGVASDYIEVDGGNSYFISIANDKTGIGMGGACYDINKTYISTPTAISIDNHTNRIDLPSNAKYMRIGFQLSTAGTITITNPQFEKGQVTTYTPYVSQTAPVNLGDIEYCKIGNYADVFMKPSGKNLFEAEYIKQSQDTSINAHLKKETYTLSLEGKPNFGAVIYIQLYKNNTMITETGHILNTSSAVSFSTSSYWYYFQNVPNTNYLTFTLDDDYDVKIALYNAVGTQRAMLNKGSVALDYEPYNNNKWYLKKNIGKVVLDGSESWEERTNSGGVKQFFCPTTLTDVLLGADNTQLCNYAKFNRSTFNWGAVGDFSILDNTKRFYICVNSSTTLSDFKTTISSNNIIAYVQQNTPTYTKLTDTTLINQLENIYKNMLSYKGTTNISQVNNDLPFDLDTTALKELEESEG